jgi:N-acyl-D-aspartate/D-glutamate deacylase
VIGNSASAWPTRPQHRELILRTLEKVEGMSFDALTAGLGRDWPFETFPEYLDAIERGGVAINVGVLLGHTPLRLYVMGEEATERAATAEETLRMRDLVREALAAGAVALATSKSPTHVGWAGRPVPSRLAELDEIRELAGALGEAGEGVLQATLGRGLFFDELGGIAAETGRTVSWTALLAGAMGPGSHRGALERAARQQQEGQRVIPQVSCRPLNFEFQWKEPFPFESMKLFAPVSRADLEGKLRIYRDPGFRRAFRESTDTGFGRALAAWWQRTWIASAPSEPGLAERPLAEVARERGVHPLDLALDLGIASGLEARLRVAIMNVDEDEVAELLLAPHTVLGLSDAGAHASQLCDACFSTHLLGHWVREKGRSGSSRRSHVDRAPRRGVRAGGSRPPRARLAGGRRRLRCGAGGRRAAAAGVRPAGRRRPSGVGSTRNRRGDRRRPVRTARRQGRPRPQRRPARTAAAPRTR